MNHIKAKESDISAIQKIVCDAQNYLASQNIDQWQNAYPPLSIIQNDITNQESYLVLSEAKKIIGINMFTTKPDPTYSYIEGKWLSHIDSKYGVIHRMAVDKNHRNQGIAKFIFHQSEQYLIESHIESMRIDTHEDNLEMQYLLKKLKYQYCGIIYLANGDKRLAFEKILKTSK